MNLIELYDSLALPEGRGRIFNALPIPSFDNFRIAVDIDANPILLLSISGGLRTIKNFKLKYLTFEQNLKCIIKENDKSTEQIFAVISFTSQDRKLKEYFLKISETLIRTLSLNPSQEQVVDSLNKFIEVFRALSDPPTKTIHGLWTELFLIENCRLPGTLLNYWHNIPQERFDFNSGSEKVEVKSNANFERVHVFSTLQLHPPPNTQVLIASIFVRQNNNGKSIQDLVETIVDKINNDKALTEKLYGIVSATLGDSIEQSSNLKFDYEIAVDSLKFYKHQDVKKIIAEHIPSEVSEVRYKSDLTLSNETQIRSLLGKGPLFDSL